jgi:neurotransmitter:Na+ symporter, NSS family
MGKERERWGSKLGVIMAVAGSAVGLGNFLRFPTQAAGNGGGAFMIPYFVALLVVGIPLAWVEWTAGRFGGGHRHSSAPGIFQSLWPKNRLMKYVGVAGIIGPLVIYMYYVYIESWCLAYAYYSFMGKLNLGAAAEYVNFLHWYQGVGTDGWFSGTAPGVVFFLITFALNSLTTYFGIRGGIEKLCNWALPALMFFGVILTIRVLTLDAPAGAPADQDSIHGLGFLWNPDYSMLANPKVWMAAAGQIFFTLSLGMGVILTYSSYLRKTDDVALSGLTAASMNEFAEVIIGGSIVIPAAFIFFGSQHMASIATSGSFNLGFVTMPQIFAGVSGGHIYGGLWFLMLFLAGITSSVSLAQPAVAFMEDEFNWSRQKAVKLFAAVAFVLCQPAVWFLHRGVLDDLDFWGGTVIIVLGATFEAVLFGWVFGIDRAWEELHRGHRMKVPVVFKYVIKYVTPTALLLMLGWWLVKEWWGVITMSGIPEGDIPFVLGLRLVLLALFVAMMVAVYFAWRGRKETLN